MCGVQQAVHVGELGDEAEPAQGLSTEEFHRAGQGSGIWLYRQGVGGGRAFEEGYFWRPLGHVLFSLAQNFFNVYIYPHIRLHAQGGLQVTVLALPAAELVPRGSW